ncbi:MAG: PRC-barrel domain-containing protein, partial [Gammaproteobacteria bacterium]|nr:PRC-barrel domain-containing protein [Gammaproteobacteria bacterium]
LRDGRVVLAPDARRDAQLPLAAAPNAGYPGAPLEPTGNPMLDGVGPGAWAQRADVVDTTLEGLPRIVPLRDAPGFGLSRKDPDPIGLPVFGADGVIGGVVTDLWVDRAEAVFRYVELEVKGAPRRVLLPITFSKIDDQCVRVRSILGAQFAHVPATRQPGQITLLEEERVVAYYGGGTLYATPGRQEPLL